MSFDVGNFINRCRVETITLVLFNNVLPRMALYTLLEVLTTRKSTSMSTITSYVPSLTLNLIVPFTGTCLLKKSIRFSLCDFRSTLEMLMVVVVALYKMSIELP